MGTGLSEGGQQIADADLKKVAETTTGTGAGQWHLVRTDVPDPTPVPDPDPTPTPTPDPDPTPTPEPDPEPTPTPDPDPEPTPEPDPDPTPTPTPDPEPNPDPAPTPDPEPEPTPAPDPTPTPEPEPTPVPPVTPDDPAEMQQIATLGISAMQAMSFVSELDDLRTRLGEVRYGAQDGAWVRTSLTKERSEGYNGCGFRQKTKDIHVGLDKKIDSGKESSWLLGSAFRYANSKQEGFAAACGGDGELDQYSFKLYATYMHDAGSYADFVVQAGRYEQELSGLANDRISGFSADYGTWGYGASIEAGHMFTLAESDGSRWYDNLFLEPQVQVSYFMAKGRDYTTSTGMKVSQEDADFLTGRAGLVLGKKVSYSEQGEKDDRYFQFALTGGVKYEFLGDQTLQFTGTEGVTKSRRAANQDGARVYYGAMADWQMTDSLRAYARVEREEGNSYTKDLGVSVGLRYAF